MERFVVDCWMGGEGDSGVSRLRGEGRDDGRFSGITGRGVMYHLIKEMFEGRHIDSGAYENRSIVKEEQRGTFGRVHITIAARWVGSPGENC